MNEGIVAIIVALLSLAGTLAGSYFAQRKSTALIAYRLEQLEKKVEIHNGVIERTFKLEERMSLNEKDIRVANHRIEDLEERVG
jgi:tetrahydromethanopterin S-methyltransferase subunit G